jgi:hypothetical protein
MAFREWPQSSTLISWLIDIIQYNLDFGKATWYAFSKIKMRWRAKADDAEESGSSSGGGRHEREQVDADFRVLDKMGLDIR